MTALRTLLCLGLFVAVTGCGAAGEPENVGAATVSESAKSANAEETAKPANLPHGVPSAEAAAKGDGEAHPDLPWKCSDDGTMCCQGWHCCVWAPTGWACE